MRWVKGYEQTDIYDNSISYNIFEVFKRNKYQ